MLHCVYLRIFLECIYKYMKPRKLYIYTLIHVKIKYVVLCIYVYENETRGRPKISWGPKQIFIGGFFTINNNFFLKKLHPFFVIFFKM
jgi:hypothetical protein